VLKVESGVRKNRLCMVLPIQRRQRCARFLGVCAVRLRSGVIFLPIRSVEPDLRDADGPFGAGCHFDPYGLAPQRGSCRMNDIEPVGLCLVRIRDIELHRAPHTLREAGDAPRLGQLHLPAAYPEYRYGGEFHRPVERNLDPGRAVFDP